MTGKRPTVQAKREAITRIENKTYSEAEQVLHALFPEAEVGVEKFVQKSNGGQRCTIELSKDAVKLLQRVRELLSHAFPSASSGELIERLAKEFVERHDPILKAEQSSRKRKSLQMSQDITPLKISLCRTASILQSETSTGISAVKRRTVMRRAGGSFEYSHGRRRCSSR